MEEPRYDDCEVLNYADNSNPLFPNSKDVFYIKIPSLNTSFGSMFSYTPRNKEGFNGYATFLLYNLVDEIWISLETMEFDYVTGIEYGLYMKVLQHNLNFIPDDIMITISGGS